MIHNPVSQVLAKSKPAKALKLVDWVCQDCLTASEKWRLVTLPKIKRELQAQRTEKPTITQDEYNRLLSIVANFKCPIGEDPRECDGSRCPLKPKPKCEYGKCELNPETCGGPTAGCYEDHYDECLEALQAEAQLAKVWRGEVKVK